MLMKKTFAYFISIVVVGCTASSGIHPSPALKGGGEEDKNSMLSNSNLRNSISTTGRRNLAKKKKGPKKKGPFDDYDEETGDTCQLFIPPSTFTATKVSVGINAVLPNNSLTKPKIDSGAVNETIYNIFAAEGIEVIGDSFFSSPPELYKRRYDIEVCGFINQNVLIEVE